MSNALVALIVDRIFWALSILILAQVIASWVVIGMRRPGLAYHPVVRFLNAVTAPLLAPLRRALDRYQGRSGFDFSPLILLLLIGVLRQVIVRMILR